MTELNLDYNKIIKVEIEDFIRYKNLLRLRLGFNQIKSVENGSFVTIPNVREIHLDNNRLKKVPPGLSSLRYLQVVFLHGNKISSVGVNDFCPSRPGIKKNLYTGISLFANPVKYWDIQPATFRCVSGRRGVQLGNFRNSQLPADFQKPNTCELPLSDPSLPETDIYSPQRPSRSTVQYDDVVLRMISF
ncbi:Asporin Precursor [Collichthys lucidus]|uniref:Asporin n=1 Tax=Collichthys lucidus TaxID=240159 RepID=A0A4U5UBV1_COLLU|nr:Asporin Precursor [Collichthys lucidus]